MVEIDSIFSSESSKKFHCACCDYSTCRKSQYQRHLTTDKHNKVINGSKMVENDSDLVPKGSKIYQCICGIYFNSRTTLWRHKKKCNFETQQIKEQTPQSLNFITTELIMELIKDNKEMKQIILEQNNTINNLVKNGVTNANGNTNSLNNNNNKTFNLQFFLNETCKNGDEYN